MSKTIRILPCLLSGIGASLLALQALAEPTIDASGVLRDIKRIDQAPLPPKADTPTQSEPNIEATAGEGAVEVRGFEFEGATLVSDALLQKSVAAYVGKTLDYQGLNKVTRSVSQLYQAQGWLARVYLPPQEINNGVVRIAITEAKLGKITVNQAADARLSKDFLLKIAMQLQQPGAPLNSKQLERALLLINDIPGVKGRAVLREGTQAAETDVLLELEDKPIFAGNAWVDNFGTRPLGKVRWHGAASLSNISGWGDVLNIHAFTSRGVDFVSGDIEMPLGYAGTRLNLGGSVSNYTILGNAANPQGDANTQHITIKHPFVRSLNASFNVYAGFDRTHSQNEALGLEVSDQKYRAFTLGAKGDLRDQTGLGGLWWGGVGLTSGVLDLSGNLDNQAVDRATAKTGGHYQKFNFYLGQQQYIAPQWRVQALFSGQLAGNNLGGFEKFSLGGPYGIKGFVNGEAAADQGWMLNLEARYLFSPEWSARIMGDAGGVCQYKNTWDGWNAANPNLQNCYQLGSAGLGVDYIGQRFNASASYHRTLSSNPGLDANGRDIEGDRNRHQFWLQIGLNF